MPTPNEETQARVANERMPLLSPATLVHPLSSSPTTSTSTVTEGLQRALIYKPPRHKGLSGFDNGHSRGEPACPRPHSEGDESLPTIFGRAVGIGSQAVGDAEPSTVEQGRKSATGIYRAVLNGRRAKLWKCTVFSAVVYTCHLVQILVGATLTAFGPVAGNHAVAITILGSVNTVTAGVLALFKGQGLQERLHKDEVEFTRLQVWIEETHALLEAGVIGCDRQGVNLLVETAFRMYNAVLASEENNRPDSYVRQEPEDREDGEGGEDRSVHRHHNSGAVIRLNSRPLA